MSPISEEPRTTNRETKPVLANYVANFLKPDMRHIYRQVTGLKAVTPWVLTQKLENTAGFPFPNKRIIQLPKPGLRWWRRFIYQQVKRAPWQLFRWELRHLLLELTRIEARVLHIYFGHVAVHLRPLIEAWPHPTVVSFHGADAGVDLDKPAHLAALREVFSSAAIVQARSESLLADLAKLGCPHDKLRLQRTGIPLEEWSPWPRPDSRDGACRILQCCRLIAKKGVDVTLCAFAEVLPSHPKSELVIVGEGPLREELQKLAAQLGIASRARFTGFLDQKALQGEMRGVDMFVHPSRTTIDGNREGVPNAMLEAMAGGVPVVATRHGGIPEAVTDGISGLLVPENDVAALAAAMRRLLDDGELAQKLGAGGRHSVEQKFDRAANIRLLESCYLDLIAADQPAPVVR
ncbi:MAG TPA: glycosyltransferase [Verrucomicrobiaceae bacterium]